MRLFFLRIIISKPAIEPKSGTAIKKRFSVLKKLNNIKHIFSSTMRDSAHVVRDTCDKSTLYC